MPGGDGTGPGSMGPMTGRAAGYCAGYPVPGFMNHIGGRLGLGLGRGRGMGMGMGRGMGRRPFYGMPYGQAGYGMPYGQAPYMGAYPYAPELNPKQEMDMLKDQAGILKQQSEDIQNRISTLEKAQAQESK